MLSPPGDVFPNRCRVIPQGGKRAIITKFALLLSITSSQTFAQQESVPQLIKRIKPSVVAILTLDATGAPLMRGSGFFIGPNRVVTNRHVIENAYDAKVKLSNGESFPVQGVVGVDEVGDLVVLRVGISPAAQVSPLTTVQTLPLEGERVLVIGNPLGLEGTISDGLVSAVRKIPDLGTIIQITAPISPGSSGSPVVNMKGQVIGVATSQFSQGQNLNFAMPGARIAQIAPYQLKTLTAFGKEIATNSRAKARSLVSQGRTIIEIERTKWQSQEGSPFRGSYPELSKQASAKALPFFQQAIKTDPQYSPAWRELGAAYEALEKYREAIASCREAVRLDPTEWIAYDNMASSYEALKEFKGAIEALRQVIRLEPVELLTFYAENQNIKNPAIQIGDFYLKLEQYDDALTAYQEALRLMPDSYEAYFSIGSVSLLNLNAPRAAIEACRQALRIKPDYDIARLVLGMAYVDNGNKAAALEEYKILKALDATLAKDLYEYIYPR